MKKLLLFIVLSTIYSLSHSQNNKVYYYERVKIVKLGVQQPSSGDGHYLSINQKGLYESNANGETMGKGFVKYVNSNNNKPLYEGSAYLGRNLTYVFNDDYSRLNLHLGEGTIYVYERRNSASSESKKRVYLSDELPPHKSDVPLITGTNNGGNQHEKRKYITCAYCKGTGRRTQESSGYISRNQYRVTCGECGKQYLNTSIHRHVQCVYCNGTGQRRLDL